MATAKFLYCIILVLLVSGSNILAGDSIPSFTAEGELTCERLGPSNTNSLSKMDGKVLFSYCDGIWQIQFIYSNYYNPVSKASNKRVGAVIDCKSIPDGIRQIITLPSNTNGIENETKQKIPSATTQATPFPLMSQQELFLPWLSLCPNPQLPIISSNLIHFDFRPQFLNNSKNEGGFNLNYIEPEKNFLSELTVSNNGTLFQSDGSALDLPAPYQNGYPQFSYKVLEVTNCDGVNFPLKTVLYQFAPSPTSKSSEDLYSAIISRLNIKQIIIGGQPLHIIPVPTNLVALDGRPTGLHNGLTVNYEVRNDQWSSLTNRRMEQLANFFRHQSFNKVKEEDKHSRNRIVVVSVLAGITLIPLILAYFTGKKNKKQKTK